MNVFKSFDLISGRRSCRNIVTAGIINAAIVLTGVLVKTILNTDAVRGFCDGFCSVFGGAIPIFISMGAMGGVFRPVLKIHPGYKYFHSLPNGEQHFRRGIIAANLLGLFCVVLNAVVGAIFYRNLLFAYLIAAAFFCLGWADLTGCFRTTAAQASAFVVVGFVFGFVPGFAEGYFEDEGFDIPGGVMAAIIGGCAVFYIVCFAVVLARTKKLWRRED